MGRHRAPAVPQTRAQSNQSLLSRLPPDLIVVNCAGCDLVLLVGECAHRTGTMEHLAGRRNGRPFCASCLQIAGGLA